VSTVLKPENQLPITPLGKASTPRVRPTVYNRSYAVSCSDTPSEYRVSHDDRFTKILEMVY